jgi:hypothetical protein
MTREEKIARIVELEGYKFSLEMKDRWSQADYATSNDFIEEIKSLKDEVYDKKRVIKVSHVYTPKERQEYKEKADNLEERLKNNGYLSTWQTEDLEDYRSRAEEGAIFSSGMEYGVYDSENNFIPLNNNAKTSKCQKCGQDHTRHLKGHMTCSDACLLQLNPNMTQADLDKMGISESSNPANSSEWRTIPLPDGKVDVLYKDNFAFTLNSQKEVDEFMASSDSAQNSSTKSSGQSSGGANGSAQWHIKPDGTVARCTATKRACPYGGADQHYPSKQAAEKAFQDKMEKEDKAKR